MWDLRSQAGLEPTFPKVEAWRLKHWTAREVPALLYFLVVFLDETHGFIRFSFSKHINLSSLYHVLT